MTVADIKPYVLLTGGLGYIGSHTVIKLIQRHYNVVIFDNLVNSKVETLSRIQEVLSVESPELSNDGLLFFQVDLRQLDDMKEIIEREFVGKNRRITSIIHFAGLKSVNESVKDPLLYYDYNFVSSLNLLKLVQAYQIHHFIFSSSATVYGDVTKFENPSEYLPLRENQTTKIPINPYGNTKHLVERLLEDYANSNPDFQVGILRYFNPIGAHPSHLIGEDPLNEPLNLLPIIANYSKLNKTLKVYGGDYQTKDGTCIRDYIHIEDLSRGHVLALNKLELLGPITISQQAELDMTVNYHEWNLGKGVGYSVLDIIKQWNKSTGIQVNYEIVPRRDGDVEILVADVEKSEKELGFICQFDLKDACQDLWGWTSHYFNSLKLEK
ncbi:hypothetical protein WICPIJ_001820 [Wickerhamomyces pijperi]|uniref:NAD-dependent epimerase/dehydratase domain-containing protein n=1 Tax=Wickerhamomyces pijperi TaxID=599730 RepID=A0A9P8QCV1_WICPI|nr:hypothetical protein WICPIJ_001820 [Wickerhamomyces pijperi]